MSGPLRQAERDVVTAWSCAANCVLYEDDPGPAQLNVGSATEPVWVSRAQAWQDAYAHCLLEALDADLARIQAAAEHYRAKLTVAGTIRHTVGVFQARRPDGLRQALGAWSPRQLHEIHQVHRRALDLCERAARMVIDAGADADDIARRRLLAGTRHATTMLALGTVIPQVAHDSTDRLTDELAALDDEEHRAENHGDDDSAEE